MSPAKCAPTTSCSRGLASSTCTKRTRPGSKGCLRCALRHASHCAAGTLKRLSSGSIASAARRPAAMACAASPKLAALMPLRSGVISTSFGPSERSSRCVLPSVATPSIWFITASGLVSESSLASGVPTLTTIRRVAPIRRATPTGTFSTMPPSTSSLPS